MQSSWNEALVVIFFVYGLAFYTLGLALLVETGRASELGFARSMRLLIGFALLHGLHEWVDMAEGALRLYNGSALPDWLLWFRLALLATSFLALLAFGEHLLARERDQHPTWRLTLAAGIWFALSSVIVAVTLQLSDVEWMLAVDVLARYVLGVPASIVACWALWRQRQVFRERGMQRFVRNLTVAAVALGLYGVVGQIITKPSMLFPSTFLNSAAFMELTGFPIQLFRAAMAIVVTVAMIRVLRALEFENQQQLEAVRRAKADAEHQNHLELTRLNNELKVANAETAGLLRQMQQRDALRGEMLQRITSAQESERQRIARELHDGTGQALTGLALGLRGLAAQVEAQPELTQRRLSTLELIATNSLGELRNLINDLRPPQLDDMGLIAALRWLVERSQDWDRPLVRLEIHGEPVALESEVETMLYRIAQEALTYALMHAKADQIWITLDYTRGPCLCVRDDGIGFDQSAPDDTTRRPAWGLAGMQERASLINGTLQVESTPGVGTLVTIVLPQPLATEETHAH